MTATGYPLSRSRTGGPPVPSPARGLGRLRPREGWLAFVLVVGLLLVFAVSLDAAEYRGGSLGWLIPVTVLGASWGLLGARSGLPRWEAHWIGALLGAGVILVFAAGQISEDADLGTRLHGLGAAAVQWYRDVSGPAHLSQQNVAWQITCGILAWSAAQFSAHALFADRRPIVAIALPGLFLLVNMIIAESVGLAFLVVYSALALLLLVQVNAAEQREARLRRRISEAADVSSATARSGVYLGSIAVIAAIVLASVGSSAPLAGLWVGVQDRAEDVALRFNDWYNVAPAVRFHGDPFQSVQRITGEWDASGTETLEVAFSDGGSHYLRGTVYDRFLDGDRWVQSGPVSTAADAGAALDALLAGDGAVAESDLVAVTVNVTLLRGLPVIISPNVPRALSIAARVETLGKGGPFAALRPSGDELPAGTSYRATTLVPRLSAAGLTKNVLRGAGTDYPADIVERYANAAADVGAYDPAPGGHPSVPQLARQIIDGQELTNPFDIADAFQWSLADPEAFTYRANIRGLCDAGETVPDCFLRIRQGYCEYYATTMILMLRSQGIPARLAVGYLPPEGSGVVTSSAAHAWVEVYFPGHGWASFDPTGGNGAGPIVYPEGPVNPERPTPGQGGAVSPEPAQPTPGADAGGGGMRAIGTSLAPILLVLAAAAVLTYAYWRRRPHRQPDVVVVYGHLTRIAGFLGFPPRPAQTVFEYTGALAEAVPEASVQLEAVARAKVEATYRPVPLERDRLEAVGQAYRKARLELARLLFRRGRRRQGDLRRVDRT